MEVVRSSPVREQSAPAAAIDTTLYTVPKGKKAEGHVFVAERGGASATFRVALRKDGAALAVQHHLAFDELLAANARAKIEDLELDEDDILTVRASTADLSFSFLGIESPRD